MDAKYAVTTVVFQTGERFPVLIERGVGLPLFVPTVFVLSEVRARNLAAHTIEQVLRAVAIFQLYCDNFGIDVGTRLTDGQLLTLAEIDGLVRYCRQPMAKLHCNNPKVASWSTLPKLPRSLEQLREAMPRRSGVNEVDPSTASMRLCYIRRYLDWLSRSEILKLKASDSRRAALDKVAGTTLDAITARLPRGRGTNNTWREGMEPEVFDSMLAVIERDSSNNPWTGEHARERNALMVLWLASLGLRRGELLGVRVSDINFQSNEVMIPRRADDPDDPRREQPNAKTSDRLLPLDENLAQRTHRYIVGLRRGIKGARSHEFLFVANGSGAPLSLSALNKIFVALRSRCGELPASLCPHVLRHTWNDRFSEQMDLAQVPEEQEKRLRRYLQGWSETSTSPEVYTRRHRREAAKKASLELQRRMMGSETDGN